MTQNNDAEIQDWIESLHAVVQSQGKDRALQILAKVLEEAQRSNFSPLSPVQTPYVKYDSSIGTNRISWRPSHRTKNRKHHAMECDGHGCQS